MRHYLKKKKRTQFFIILFFFFIRETKIVVNEAFLFMVLCREKISNSDFKKWRKGKTRLLACVLRAQYDPNFIIVLLVATIYSLILSVSYLWTDSPSSFGQSTKLVWKITEGRVVVPDQLIIEMNQFNKTEEIYEVLLNRTSNGNWTNLAFLHHQPEYVYNDKWYLTTVLSYYQPCSDIFLIHVRSNHPEFSWIYSNIGEAFLTDKWFWKYIGVLPMCSPWPWRKNIQKYSISIKNVYIFNWSIFHRFSNIGNIHQSMKDYFTWRKMFSTKSFFILYYLS